MKRKLCIGVAGALLAAGCGNSEAPIAVQPNQPAVTATTHELPQIDVSTMPKTLPRAVAAQLCNVVAVRIINQANTSPVLYA